ncbi:hypothetical protein [Streptomyces sp. HD]|uniref:hypothetical protein n=1 Tax=Streptomyces sp. HD TaxID=3020892 RepID=UPI00232E2D63|nr:hypothetical protein [Streptomyces sp. HD]MDC0772395.1 hypothetical protein [Streptomyces sp. HD]
MNDFQDRAPVHQVLFRWDGNQGRQDTGMHAVAHSCEAGRAGELARELGSLLWVSGAAAARPSVVRTLSRDGDVLLVQRWPTKDRGGRPSTVSHVLVGGPDTLTPGRCLGLAYGGWRGQDEVEQASGGLPEFDRAELERAAWKRRPEMVERLPEVQHALILATAELLRDPRQRVSLLLEEKTPRDWPTPDLVPVAYLGLVLIFGPWLKKRWTFATYDTVDSHPLRLMAVPRWDADSGESGPLARVRGRVEGDHGFEHWAAFQLVTHLLAHPDADPGVPQLVGELPDGATMDWGRRSEQLKRILGAGPATGTRPAPRRPDPTPPPPPTAPAPPPPSNGHDTHALHRDLLGNLHGDGMQRHYLIARLKEQSDEVLLHELSFGEELPPESLDLLLRELGRPDRVDARHPEMQHALCTEVLLNGLYFNLREPSPAYVSEVDRAADLFTWAVAPFVRDPRHQPHLAQVLHLVGLSPLSTDAEWLRKSILRPANGPVPDLPPEVWRQLVEDKMSQPGTQPAAPPPLPEQPPPQQPPAEPPLPLPPPPSVFKPLASQEPVPQPPVPPQTVFASESSTLTGKLSDLTNRYPGRALGSVALLFVVVFLVLWAFS